jgi:NAD(P)-dependent dehydrogenase (short-subunit alcohol dehydrogenase family)
VAVSLDLADLASVRKAAAEIDGRVERLDVLMNNGGVMAVPRSRTVDGFETHLGINHLGHFALTGLLLPALQRAAAPRVVTTSSMTHRQTGNRWDDPHLETRPYSRATAYAQSKLANLLFTRALAGRAGEAGSDLVAVAAHPGYAATQLFRPHASADGTAGRLVARVGAAAVAIGNGIVAQSAAAGALPQLYAATMPDVAPGEYFGPKGPLELRGGPTRVGRSAAAQDDEAAEALCALSEELTGVTYAW